MSRYAILALVFVLACLSSCTADREAPASLQAVVGPANSIDPSAVVPLDSLPSDGLQPWESLDADGHVIPAGRSAASINASTDITSGVERFLDSGDIAGNGEALRLNGTDDSASSYAMYRVSLGAGQPGIVSIDANLLGTGSQYYVGVSNYGTGRWDWRGPFTDNHVRLPVVTDGGGDYTSSLGNTFVSVLVNSGSSLEIVGVGINQFDLADAVAPTTPLGLSITPVNGGLELNWSPVLEADLAGYRIYYSGKSFVNPNSAGVQSVPYLEGSTQHMLSGLKAATFVAVAAVDFAGNESALSSLESASPLLAAPGSISLTGSAASGGINEAIMLSASGADLYDWDLDGDGVFEIADDNVGNQAADTSATGLIRPRVRGRDTTGERVALGGLSLLVSGNTRPVASATADPQSGSTPLAVTFTGLAEDNEDDASALSYAWDFDGDGIYENGTNTLTPSLQNYAVAGLYAAKFRVTDSEGAWDVDTVPVHVSGNLAPHADLTVQRTSGDAPFTAQYNASSSMDPDGSITLYEWDFDGDGNVDESGTDPFTQHTFAEPGEYYSLLRVTDDAGASAETQLGIISRGWITHTIDDNGDPGVTLSMAVIDGNPAIAYYNLDDQELQYVRSLSPTGREASDWINVILLAGSGDQGAYPSLVVVDGKPAVSFQDFGNKNMLYMRALNTTGAAPGDWGPVVVVDDTEDVGEFASMAIVDGNPAIAYVKDSGNDIKYARSTTTSGESAADWSQFASIDPGPDNVGQYTQLAVVQGNPAVAYRNSTTNSLMYVRSSTPTGAADADWLQIIEVDTGVNNGHRVSMAIVNGNPAIAYWDPGENIVKYVRSLTATGGSLADWAGLLTVDDLGTIGQSISLAVIGGRPAISYMDNEYFHMKLAWSSSPNGAGSADWQHYSAADSEFFTGQYTSLVEVQGKPAMAYHDGNKMSLKYAIYYW